MGSVLKTLHLVRQADDLLAWEVIRADRPGDEVKVVLLGDAPPPAGAAGLAVVAAGGDYDEVVRLMEWADKTVVW